MNGNGASVKLTWVVNGLLSVVLLLVSWWAAAMNDRIHALEAFRGAVEIDVNVIKWDVKRMSADVCRTEGKLDDLTEYVTKRRVFRTPCQ